MVKFPFFHLTGPLPNPEDELKALRELREICGMYCEQLPIEVREALHAVPEINKTHKCNLSKTRDTNA